MTIREAIQKVFRRIGFLFLKVGNRIYESDSVRRERFLKTLFAGMSDYKILSKMTDADISTIAAVEFGKNLKHGEKADVLLGEIVARLQRANGGQCP